MFSINKINLFNFKSYKGTHEFTFPSEGGLYFFTGQAKLGSNGAGKSTLLDAIVWALYGRTSRGLKGRDIITWGQTTCRVELEITIGDKDHRIKRSQKPNTIHLDGKPIDQDSLERALRLNYQSFLHAVIKPQFGFEFLSMPPSEKLTLFSDILNLDYWLQKSSLASEKAKAIDVSLNQLVSTLDQTKGKTENMEMAIAELEEKSATFAQDKKARVKIAVGKANAALKELFEAEDEFSKKSYPGQAELSQAETELEEALTFLGKANADVKGLDDRIKSITEQLAKQLKVGDYCHYCGQEVIDDEGHKPLTKLDLNIFRNERVPSIRDLAKRALQDVVRKKSNYASITAQLEEFQAKKRHIKELELAQQQALQEADRAKEEINPYIELLNEKKTSLAILKKKMTTLETQSVALESDYTATSYWTKGFKRVRLFLIEQAFTTLEVEVNNSLSQLGMPDWQITFDIERENKSGGITKGFITFVQGPDNPEPVRWESWSGGESQRLQLAANLGLSNLIMQQAGLINTIEFFDEPSIHLSPEGMMDLANLLHDRAINEDKRIWIVDHAAITNFGEFRGVITVRKTKNGSQLDFTRN